MNKVSAFLVLFVANLAFAAPPTITVPKEVAAEVGDFIQVPATTDGQTVKWVSVDKGLNLFPIDQLKNTRTAVAIGKLAGVYRLIAYTSNADGPSDPAICTITVGTPTPGPNPPGPNPPGPNPPEPPDPFTKKKDPFATSGAPPGFRVMTVYDDDKRKDYPDAQRQILYSQLVMGYYRDHCIKGPNGAPDWRNFPIGIDLSEEDPMWAKVMALPRKSDPWVYIGNGKTGYSGPLPGNTDDMLKLLNKYGNGG